ncbi:MAG: outer membrane protein assembly factor BamC [Gammaproteobacteria bacterium]|nr:outer membrane protein assembly factor BamC [Gammaproteobacteria bacterium]MCP5298665.1 outer membrane protein assembly factor BamC [Chromatiaceae bacterium]
MLLSACGGVTVDDVLPDKQVEYKRERQAERNLEIPPDLTTDRINDRMSVPDNFGGVSTSYSEYVTDRKLRGADAGVQQAASSSVLPAIKNVEVRRDGDVRWLAVDAPVAEVWQRIIDFWQDSGILMVEQDPGVGIMRTSWLENRANISRDFITDTFRKVLDGFYEAGTRDQYRVRLERAENGGTEVYLTHYGMEEQVLKGSTGDVERTVWVPRERDPGLEVEMLRRMMVYFGAADERARVQLASGNRNAPSRSQLVNTGTGAELRIDESFSRAWRLIGLALDRVGFAVEDRDRSQGIYYVRYNDPSKEEADEGWLSKLAFWSDDKDVDKINRYQVKVNSDDAQTSVTVNNEQGQRDGSPTAVRILTLLKEQIR